MVETIALVIALLCLIGDSPSAAAIFLVVGVGAAAWRAYNAREEAKRVRVEVDQLRAELQRATTLAERAVRIAAETANAVTLGRHAEAASSGKVETPASATPPKPVATPERESVAFPQKPEIPREPAAAQKIAEPIAPKVAPPEPVIPTASVPPPPPRMPEFVPMSRPAAKPLSERLRGALALEEVLGTNWLSKLGVIILVLGIALFGIYELGQLGPFGKIGLSVAAALGLLVGGIYLERKERFAILGRTGIGGGWALLFFTTYAMNHVAAMRVIGSGVVDSVLMLVVAAAMVVHTLRYRSQLVTGLAFLLAYSTVALSHDTVYSLAAGAILATAIVAIVLKMEWYELDVFAILSSYGNHFYWLYQLLGERGAEGHAFPQFGASAALLAFYWAAFRASYVLRRVKTAGQENLSTVAALLNTVLLLAVMKFQSARPELAFYALLVLGALEFAIGQLRVTRRRRMAFVVLTMLGTALMIAAVPFKYSGQNVSILWLVGGEVLLFAGVFAGEKLFRRLGLATGLVVLGHVLVVELPKMVEGRFSASGLAFATQGVLLFVMAAIFYGNIAALRMRWPDAVAERFDGRLLTATSYPGAITLAIACWAVFVRDGMALAFAIAMFAVALLAYRLKAIHLQAQSFGLGALAVLASFTTNAHWGDPRHLASRVLSLAGVAAVFYVTAKFAQHAESPEQRMLRGAMALAGTAVAALLLAVEVPASWQPLAFALFAWGLIEGAWLARYFALRWHGHAMALFALGYAAWPAYVNPNLHAGQPGLWKLIPVVAVFYVLSERAPRVSVAAEEWARAAYSWAGTAVGVWLLYQWVPDKYVAAAWAGYALALTAVHRWRKWQSFGWQAFVLGVFAAVQCVVINLLESTSTAGVHDNVRLLVCGAVIVALYAMAETLRLSERGQQLEALHSWMASALAGTLLWYELSSVSVAVAWALLGVVLYEYGAWRRNGQLRWQGFLALSAAFVRIFFANLTVGAPGEVLSTRVLTVVPVALALFYVYMREGEQVASRGGKFAAGVLAYFGTAAVMALCYFQIADEWVATAWAVMVMLLLAVALLLKRGIFAQQAVLMTIAVLVRGMVHNLFGGSYFSGADWRGRFAVLGSAILLLFASIPLGFEYRKRSAVDAGLRGIRRAFAVIVHRVEQPLFFVPVALLTTMLALKMDHGMVTLAWGVEAVLIFVGALLARERSFRLTGVLLLLACVAKIVTMDVWRLGPRDKYLTLIALGASLLLVSFLYSKYRETIRQYL